MSIQDLWGKKFTIITSDTHVFDERLELALLQRVLEPGDDEPRDALLTALLQFLATNAWQ